MNELAWHRYGPEPSDGAPPLVLLHGFPLDSRMWAYTISAAPQLPVITIDAPGFGASPPVDGGLDAYADAVAATLEHAGMARAVVAGLSMGGYAALELAQRHPHLLAGIGLLDTKAGADPQDKRVDRLQMAEDALGEAGARAVAPMLDSLLAPGAPEAVRTEVAGWLRHASPSGIAWAQRAMAARADRLATLTRLDVPALVLRGAQDATASLAEHEEMATALGTQVIEVDGAGHLSALESPHEVAAALSDLYARATA
ncbi:alpha/beta fold hydrolase [Ruania zhangjianzhongii]|uniref:alpha/beta fold hydrolase n=1 Tax=Ruania zhangjianzhongii TaxID=2603206 RepID=UPI001F3B4A5F|nr:alpha/beta hydrolase [Ruania zhangjianzhongii]